MSDDQVKATDPRHERRIQLMQILFASTFMDAPQEIEDQTTKITIDEILSKLEDLDQEIAQFATERPLAEINKIDLAILRLIVFESRYKKTPKKVLIDEAVELAKEFGTETSPKFINGVLGKLLMISE